MTATQLRARLSRISRKLRWRSPPDDCLAVGVRRPPATAHETVTAVTTNYQTQATAASALAVPAQMSVALNEIAADMREGLLAVGAGSQVIAQLMESMSRLRVGLVAVTTPSGPQPAMAPRSARGREE